MTVISSCAMYIRNQYIENHTFELFYNQLKLDVTHLQTTAMKDERYMKLIFDTGGTRYIGRKSLYDHLFVRNLPPGYRLSSSSTLNEIGFQPTGTIEKFGTLTFITPGGNKNVRLFIGKGRMTFE